MNISPNSFICIDILKKGGNHGWTTIMNFQFIALSIVSFLDDPNPGEIDDSIQRFEASILTSPFFSESPLGKIPDMCSHSRAYATSEVSEIAFLYKKDRERHFQEAVQHTRRHALPSIAGSGSSDSPIEVEAFQPTRRQRRHALGVDQHTRRQALPSVSGSGSSDSPIEVEAFQPTRRQRRHALAVDQHTRRQALPSVSGSGSSDSPIEVEAFQPTRRQTKRQALPSVSGSGSSDSPIEVEAFQPKRQRRHALAVGGRAIRRLAVSDKSSQP